MAGYSDSLDLPPTTFTILRDLIHERLGAFYDQDRRELLAAKLSPRVIDLGFGSFLDYYYLLRYDDQGGDEWQVLADLLSVPESYFWREIEQIEVVVRQVLPAYVAEHPGQPVRIWSAACAGGEEPLTIAMALDQAGWFERVPIEIIGSDASAVAIKRAQRGVYRDRAFRALPLALQERYFTPQGDGWQVIPAVHQRVRWRVVNLLDQPAVASFDQVPFVFCRNVFIYFSKDVVRRTVDLFWQNLPEPGYLCIGAAESLIRVPNAFELCSFGSAFVYVKGKCEGRTG